MTTFGTPGSVSEHTSKLPLAPVSSTITEAPLNAYPSPPPQDSRPKTAYHSPPVAPTEPQPESPKHSDSQHYSFEQPRTAQPAPAAWTPVPTGDQGYFRPSHSAYSSHSPVSSKSGSLSSTDSADNDVPLSMRFMYKPSRSGDQLRMASDPTRRNSIINAHIEDAPAPAVSPILDGHGSPVHSRSSSMDESTYRLVRKKSGEIVKSSLKDSYSYARSKSLPSTPSFKSVHFGNDNDIRYFSKKDRPAAISASNSPSLDYQIDPYDDDDMSGSEADLSAQTEFDYFDEELSSLPDRGDASITKYPTPHHGRLIDWDVKVVNFPTLPIQDRINSIRPPVILERVFVSADKKFLLGHIAVSNITYEKYVTVRYTLDNWATIVEIPTIYVPDIPASLKKNNYDRFVFKIPLDSMFNSFHIGNEEEFSFSREHQKLYHLCIRYCLPGHEFWDNNGGKDYSIKIKKTIRTSEEPLSQTSVSEKQTKQNGQATQQPPHLRGGAPAPPKNARSKPEAHSQRPKYSSHYMKRFHSESDLKTASQYNKQTSKETKAVDPNDFDNNGLFLSSPMFSSIKSNRVEDLDNDGIKSSQKDHAAERRALKSAETPPLLGVTSTLQYKVPPPIDRKAEERSESNISRLDSKSYKELLEAYCFSTAPSQDLGSSNSSPIEPCVNGDVEGPKYGRSFDSDIAFTVSSFLRN